MPEVRRCVLPAEVLGGGGGRWVVGSGRWEVGGRRRRWEVLQENIGPRRAQ